MELEATFSMSGHRVTRKLIAPRITHQRIVLPVGTTDYAVNTSGFTKITEAIFFNETWDDGEIEVTCDIEGGPVGGHVGCGMFPGVIPGTVLVSHSANEPLTLQVVIAGE